MKITAADVDLSRALVALAEAAPMGDEALDIWRYLGRVADRYGCAMAIRDLGRGTTADAAAALPDALRLVAARVTPAAPTLADMLRDGRKGS